MTKPLQLTALRGDAESLHITWSDGVIHHLRWSLLREKCPCATCRVKRDAPSQPAPLLQVLKPEEAQPLRATAMQPLGNYAYHIDFSDGHNTGIYSLEFLRQLGEEST